MTPCHSLRSLVVHCAMLAAALTLPARAVPPAAPTGFTLTWNAAGVINSSWTDRSNNEAGFYITYRTTPAAQFSIYDTLPANTTTFTDTPTTWLGCASFEWAVFAYKGAGATLESAISNIVTVTAPRRVSSASYEHGLTGLNFSHQLTTSCPGPAWTAAPLPAGLTLNPATGVISGNPPTAGRTTVNVTLTSGGITVSHQLKIHIFRPVPALAEPVNPTPLPDLTLRRNATPHHVDAGAHFNDPDVTDASRLVFNTGTIDFLYYPAAAPATVTNFKGYISRGDFVNTIIHRSIPGFVLQGGGYKAEAGTPSITRQPAVVNEPEISNTRGTVAMAKSGGDPTSATSEFFMSLADNSSNLNNQNEGFSAFARVPAAGMAIADRIASLCTFNYSSTNGVLTDCPVTTFGPPCPVPKPAAPAFSPAALVTLLSAGPVAPLAYASESSVPAVCAVSVNGAQLTLTPLTPGTAVITVTATDLDNLVITRTFSVTVEEHLSDWLTAQNFPNGADASATGDPDFDSAENIIEFAMMTDPQSSTPLPGPVASTTLIGTNRYLTLAFPVRKLAGSGLLYSVEASSGLAGVWETVWTSAQGFAHPQVLTFTDLPDRTNVTIRDTATVTAGQRRFLRLRVTDTP